MRRRMMAAWAKAGGLDSVNFSMNCTGDIDSNFHADFTAFSLKPLTITWWFKSNIPLIHGAMINYTGPHTGGGDGFSVGWGATSNTMESDGKSLNVLYNTIAWKGGYTVQDYTTWTHYAFSLFADNSSKLYVNGMLAKSFNASGVYKNISNFMVLGYKDKSAYRFANGRCTRVCLFKDVISDSDILRDKTLGITPPQIGLLDHYYDGTVIGDVVKDMVGTWDLVFGVNATVVSDHP